MHKNIEMLIEQEVKSLLENFRGFSISILSKIRDPLKRFRYLNKTLPKIGQGSSRVVFGIGSGKVLKIAGNYEDNVISDPSFLKTTINNGIRQNKEEVSIYTDPNSRQTFTKIFDFDAENFTWLIAEAVRETDYKEFEDYFKLPYIVFVKIIGSGYSQEAINRSIDEVSEQKYLFKKIGKVAGLSLSISEEVRKYLFDTLETPNIKSIIYSIQHSKLLTGDVITIKHWGKTTNGRLVLLDYGFTDISRNDFQ